MGQVAVLARRGPMTAPGARGGPSVAGVAREGLEATERCACGRARAVGPRGTGKFRPRTAPVRRGASVVGAAARLSPGQRTPTRASPPRRAACHVIKVRVVTVVALGTFEGFNSPTAARPARDIMITFYKTARTAG